MGIASIMTELLVSKSFCQKLPKIELHAHLNGSISDDTLQRLLRQKGDNRVKQEQLTIKEGHSDSLDEVFSKFKQIHQISDTEEAIYQIACDVIRDFSDDNVKYLELRSTPREKSSTGLTKRKYIEAVLKAIEEQERECPNIIVRFLPSIDRRQTKEEIWDTILLVEEYRKSSNGRIVGMDLSGDPTAGSAKELSPLLLEARRRGLKLAVHLGEIPGESDALELLKLLPDRVGHGTFLHPALGGTEEMLKIMTENKLPLELCLSSNVKGQTVKAFDQHHFQHWFKHGQPLTLATDDKGVFSTTLSNEYHIAAETYNLTAEQLWIISLSSVDYIFADDSVKQALKETWFSSEEKTKLFTELT